MSSTSIQQNSSLVDDLRLHENDTGSACVQAALLTAKIESLAKHCESNKKDFGATRRLVEHVEHRRKLLTYLRKNKSDLYYKTIKVLNLRK